MTKNRKKATLEPKSKHPDDEEVDISIDITNGDLSQLKNKAEEEGIPYQTLIASVLHKYVTGRLVAKHP